MFWSEVKTRSEIASEDPNLQVARVYLILLGRSPDADGLEYWTAWLQYFADRSFGVNQLVGQFMNSEERRVNMPIEKLCDHLRELLGMLDIGSSVRVGVGQCVKALRYSHPRYVIPEYYLHENLAHMVLNPYVVEVMQPQVEACIGTLVPT